MKHYLVFAGTTEGRELTSFLLEKGYYVTACTATEYGRLLLPDHPKLEVISRRMDTDEMFNLMKKTDFTSVFDATHPYAVIASTNIRAACSLASLEYIRILRPELSPGLKHSDTDRAEHKDVNDKIVYCASMEEAVSFLINTTGNILSAIGSKELYKLTALPDYSLRVYARILPNPDMVKAAYELGFKGKHLLCMQGPFSYELNCALIKQYDISFLITKSSGKNGGFEEKIDSALSSGCTCIVIGRPTAETEGITIDELIRGWDDSKYLRVPQT